MKSKGTTDAIFIVRQMQEKFRAKGKTMDHDDFPGLFRDLKFWSGEIQGLVWTFQEAHIVTAHNLVLVYIVPVCQTDFRVHSGTIT